MLLGKGQLFVEVVDDVGSIDDAQGGRLLQQGRFLQQRRGDAGRQRRKVAGPCQQYLIRGPIQAEVFSCDNKRTASGSWVKVVSGLTKHILTSQLSEQIHIDKGKCQIIVGSKKSELYELFKF